MLYDTQITKVISTLLITSTLMFTTSLASEKAEMNSLKEIKNIPINDKRCRLTIKKSGLGAPFRYGEEAKYNIKVTNNGNAVCKDIYDYVYDRLPANMQYISIDNSSPFSCTSNIIGSSTHLTCDYQGNPILPHESVDLTVKVQVPSISDATGYGWKKSEVTNCARFGFYKHTRKKNIGIGISLNATYSCTTTPIKKPIIQKFCTADTMLILDRSSSMGWGTGKMEAAKHAAIDFSTIALGYVGNRVGVGSFNGIGTLDLALSSNQSAINTAINSLTPSGGTNIDAGFNKGLDELINNSSLSKRLLVLLSDGQGQLTQSNVINNANNNNITIYTIGYGSGASPQLAPIATATGGLYFQPPSNSDLTQIYREIAKDACQASISGMKFNDLNGNSVKDANEPALKGITIRLYDNNQIIDSVVTDTNGFYRFSNVSPGTYVVEEVVPSGWEQTAPTTDSGTYPITITTGQKIANKDFGNRKINKTTSISGMKFNDLNGNSVHDAQEPPLEGVTIQLYTADSNNNPIAQVDSDITDATGKYSFTNLVAGHYIVREVVGSLGGGWTQTYPVANQGQYIVNLALGQNITNYDFGNTKDICDARIHGIIYNDTNNNGIFDGIDTGLNGWVIELTNQNNGNTISFVTSQNNGYSDGKYAISIPANIINNSGGTLLVRLSEWEKPFWEHTQPTSGEYYSIPVGLNDDLEYNFGNFRTCGGKSQAKCSNNRKQYSDISVYAEDKTIIIENKGDAPVRKMGMIIKNYTNAEIYTKLKNWQCASNSTMKQVSCRYKGKLDVREKIQLSLPYEKMKNTHLEVFTDNELNNKNNVLKF